MTTHHDAIDSAPTPGRPHALRGGRFCLLALLFLPFAVAQPAFAQLGIAAGANYETVSDIGQVNFDGAAGFHAGLFFDLKMGGFALRPGIYYTDVGTFDINEPSLEVDGFDLNLIEIPVDARFRFATESPVRPYLMAGPVIRIAGTSEDAFDDSINKFSVAGNAGIGIEIGNARGFSLYPELRYTFGISRLANDFEFLGGEFDIDDSIYLNTFMLRLGVTF
jgi:hypothetical protein